MIRAVLAHRGALVRGALARLLTAEKDISVVAELGPTADVAATVRSQRPDVAVLDLALMGVAGLLSGLRRRQLPDCGVLVLAEARRCGALAPALRPQSRRTGSGAPGLGFLGLEGAPERLAEAVRQVARGEPVIDADLLAAASQARNPLTSRESEVLALAAAGHGAGDIAANLCLSTGTVRNNLSRIIAKTGSRTRWEAVCAAQRAGWI